MTYIGMDGLMKEIVKEILGGSDHILRAEVSEGVFNQERRKERVAGRRALCK